MRARWRRSAFATPRPHVRTDRLVSSTRPERVSDVACSGTTKAGASRNACLWVRPKPRRNRQSHRKASKTHCQANSYGPRGFGAALGLRALRYRVVALCLHGAELVRDSVGKVSVYARPGLGLLRAKLGSGHGLGCNADGFDAQVALALELEARLASEDGRLIYHG